VRFELTKQIAQDLKSCPFDRSGTLAFDYIVVHMGTRTPNLKVRSLTRYPLRYTDRFILNKYKYNYNFSLKIKKISIKYKEI
jgi:hypothetical protein